MKRLCLMAAALCCSLFLGAQNTLTVYLSGKGNDDPVEWDFYCTEGRNSGVWTKIAVPSNWECQGFGQYTYGHMKQEDRLNESGIYKRSFDVPREWRGRRVSIVFGGVMTDTQVLVNGKSVGEKHQGGYYEFRYDVSGLLKYGTANSLEVRVDKSSSDPDVVKAERNADFWVFGGIFRPVWLEVRPQTCIETFALDAKADGSLKVKAAVAGKLKDCELVARVRTLDGKAFGDPVRAAVNENGATVLEGSFVDPALWSAEYPNLYYLGLDLVKGGEVIHHVDERFGFRTVEVRKADGVYVNGTRIKFRGVNRHSFWPTTGRTLNDRINLEDALLIKEMNMNAVRMSHYPPDRRFLDVCDSLGLYVIDERTGWQDAYGTDVCRKLIRELVLRDRNHPSVLLWANGNEGGFNLDLVDEYAKWDLQARHVIHPWKDEELTDTFHYPKWNSLKGYLAGIRKIWFPTEFNHGLYDGGHGAGLEDYWDLMYASPLCAGGFLWDLIDQGLVRDDEGGRLDTDGNHGADGIVGPYREREGSFYAIKDIWCPVQIELTRYLPESFDGRIKVENRYDFTNLRECSFSATFRKIDFLSGAGEDLTVGVASPDVAPGLKGWLRVPCPEDFSRYDVMLLKVCGPDGKELYTWSRNISDAGTYAANILEQDKQASGALPLESLRFTSDPGKDAYLKVQDAGNGWTEVNYNFHKGGFFDNVGVTFDYPEEKIKAVRWLGNGPYRVWKNRMRGATFGLWNLARNDTATGESWDYPEFKGYRSNMYAADIETEDGIIRLVFASDDLFLRILTPDAQVLRNNDNTLGVFPEGQISVLNAISPVGTKFSTAEETGPQGGRNYVENSQIRSETSASGRFYIKFKPY